MNFAALDPWRSEVSQRRVTFALLAGLVATHIATVTGFWYRIIELPDLSWPAFNGILLLVHQGVTDATGTQQFWAGSIYHYLTGICYALIFVFLIHPLLPFRNTVLGNLGKALIWAGVLGTLSAGLWVPKNFPEFGPGLFTNNLGWKTVLGIYIWHLVYGLHLGLIYSPKDAVEPAR